MEEYLFKDLTSSIIQAFYKVYNTLGYGFLEKVYENALRIELLKSGFDVEKQKPVKVFYDSIVVGEYFADLIVDGKVIIELKTSDSLIEEHECQLINYLKATDIEVGLLLSFGKTPIIRRKIFMNKNKSGLYDN
ncbi:MAG TPA: GxxExxY protein [Ignavibacteriaceae bacterium]|nr:GxxExxY protein [Ignavibacteriaceae bacterium]